MDIQTRLPFELQIPGTWLDLPDQAAASEVEGLLYSLYSALDEAAIALVLFEQSNGLRPRKLDKDAWDADMQRRRELEEVVLRAVGEEARYADSTRVLVDSLLLRENFQRGVLPDGLLHHLPFVYAKTFLYAADTLGKLFGVLGKDARLPAEVRTACDGYYDRFPDLKGVRDTNQHIEDRARWLDKDKKPLQLKPVDNGMIKASGGALILNNLNGNRYGSTMNDGSYGEVEISAATLGEMRDHIEDLLRALKWKGSPQLRPHL